MSSTINAFNRHCSINFPSILHIGGFLIYAWYLQLKESPDNYLVMEWHIASDYGKRNNMNQDKGEMIKRAIKIPDLL